jgi:hypothetical protein
MSNLRRGATTEDPTRRLFTTAQHGIKCGTTMADIMSTTSHRQSVINGTVELLCDYLVTESCVMPVQSQPHHDTRHHDNAWHTQAAINTYQSLPQSLSSLLAFRICPPSVSASHVGSQGYFLSLSYPKIFPPAQRSPLDDVEHMSASVLLRPSPNSNSRKTLTARSIGAIMLNPSHFPRQNLTTL